MGERGEGGLGEAEVAAVEVLQFQVSTQVVDGPVINSDNFPQSEGRIEGASNSVYPQSGRHSFFAADSTGAFLVQVQLLDESSMSLVIDTVVHSSEAHKRGWLGGRGWRLSSAFSPGVGAHHTGDELMSIGLGD